MAITIAKAPTCATFHRCDHTPSAHTSKQMRTGLKPLVLVSGASGQHASVVYEAAILSGRNVLGFVTLDASPPPRVLECPLLGGSDILRDEALLNDARFIVAVGSNGDRQKIAENLIERGACLETVVHPQAIISPSALIGDGTVVLAGAVIGTAARIGQCCIINHSAGVDHNCEVSDFVNICPGARLCGAVSVSEGAFVGLNACVLQGLRVGKKSIVGAGAVVTRDVQPETTVVGIPARQLAHG